MNQPPWNVWKISSEELQNIVRKHHSSEYRLYSKFQIGEKFFKCLKVCDPSFENFVNVSQDVFHMVEVTDVSSNKDQQITVKAKESRFANNWMLEKEDLYIDIIMYNDLAILMEPNVKPMDIFIIWGGRLLYRENKRCLETNPSCSLTPTNIVLFRPRSEKEVSTILSENTNFLSRLFDYPIFQYDEIKYRSVMELLKLYPRVKDDSESDYEWQEVKRTDDIIDDDDVVDSPDSENEPQIPKKQKLKKKKKSKTQKKGKKCVIDDSDPFQDNVNISFDSVNSGEEVLTPDFVNKINVAGHNHRKRNSKTVSTFSQYQDKCAKFK